MQDLTSFVILSYSFTIELVVASIEETANKYSIPKAFIGLILLPLVVRRYHSFIEVPIRRADLFVRLMLRSM